MAALDPTESAPDGRASRTTLRLIKPAFPGLDGEDDEDEDDSMALLGSDDDDDESNGGPSDPDKALERRKAAAIEKLVESMHEAEMEQDKMNGVKGKSEPKTAKGKGKAKAVDDGDDDEEPSSDYDSVADANLENYIVCTLDTDRVGVPPV